MAQTRRKRRKYSRKKTKRKGCKRKSGRKKYSKRKTKRRRINKNKRKDVIRGRKSRKHRVLGSALRRGAQNVARQSRPVFRNITNQPKKPTNLDKKVLEKLKDMYELDDKYRDNAIKLYKYKPSKTIYYQKDDLNL
jgi:hypothetical protein